MVASLAIRCLANLANLAFGATKNAAGAHGRIGNVPRAQQAARHWDFLVRSCLFIGRPDGVFVPFGEADPDAARRTGFCGPGPDALRTASPGPDGGPIAGSREDVVADETPPTVLITGAAQRIGRALAGDFARRGWRVAIHCRASQRQAQELAQELGRGGAATVVLPADLADAGAVAGLIPECSRRLGPPTCLINNAAMFAPDAIGGLDGALWDTQLAVNLKAPVFLAEAFAKALPPRVAGNIINIIDQGVLKPTPQFFSYTVSKAALWAATRTLAQALAPRIRVNAIGPGPVLPSLRQSQEDFERECRAAPLGRAATVEEVCRAVRFLLDSPSVTGHRAR
jgi:NAD(P)-dependent dehydrogenase (short-subunit alcohol dehydrogenase family)